MSKENEITTTTGSALQIGSLAPKTIEEAMKFCEFLAKSTIVPKDYQEKPANIFVAVQWGMEIGLAPLQAMQNIAVINNRPSLWGDAMLALVMSSPVFESIDETLTGTGIEKTAICAVKRKGQKSQVRTFTYAEAKKAGLIGKVGPWTNYENRMLQMRARAFALRDVFPDVLKGMAIAEEVMDIEADYTDVTDRGKPIVAAPQAKTGKTESATETTTAGPANQGKPNDDAPLEPHTKLIFKRLQGTDITSDDVCRYMKVAHIRDITKMQTNDVLDAIKKGELKHQDPNDGADPTTGEIDEPLCEFCGTEVNDEGHCHTTGCPGEGPAE